MELQSSEALSEQTLIERAKEDPQAFGNLFDRYYPAIFAYILRRVGKWNDAQDITSEVFLKALKGLWRFRWHGIPFSAWLWFVPPMFLVGAPLLALALNLLALVHVQLLSARRELQITLKLKPANLCVCSLCLLILAAVFIHVIGERG